MTNKNIAESLRTVLADTYILYFKTHGFHWNVTGPRFKALHEMFEEQYTEMWGALDILAERLRTLGETAPANTNEITKHALNLKPANDVPSGDDMVAILADDHRKIVDTLTKCADLADDEDDLATEDLMVQRIAAHEKMAWMLEATAQK